MSQSDVQRVSGIKREYLSKLENNELKNPTYNTICKLCNAFHISLAVFFGGVDKHAVDKEVDKLLEENEEIKQEYIALGTMIAKIITTCSLELTEINNFIGKFAREEIEEIIKKEG
jgi:transcriptional regulator with XRE-family HTH domain